MYMDPIADLICKIKNANMAKLPYVKIQTSSLTTNILKIMQEEGYILGFEQKVFKAKKKNGKKQFTYIKLKYKNRIPVINGIKQISKPGLRIYQEAKKIPKVLNGLGIAIISTTQGIITDKLARKNNVGGEIIAYLW